MSCPLGDDGAAKPEAGGVAEILDGGDLAQLFDDSGEHFPGPPASSGTDSGAVETTECTSETPGATPDGLVPHGTITVGGAHECPLAAHCLPSGL
ncbi:hypothetical protein GCM10010254_45680 [Streptomyces chromofuscus]|nr:hypothetical protein GCM10010254_45680 [Streptomyces chromofuscus]